MSESTRRTARAAGGGAVRRTIVIGAAGRDFHNFLVALRDDPEVEVVAFTAAQIPHIEERCFPAALAGPRYPNGIPIVPESRLEETIRKSHAHEAIFSYSDLSHEQVMHVASRVLATGADFRILGPESTLLGSRLPVISVCAVRTGSGKSQTTRRVCELLRAAGKRPVAVRHPMPYGDLLAQSCQRFASEEDLRAGHCTIEEREEYEPLLQLGLTIFAGVDYAAILERAEAEADIIVWDGGNNDLPFYRPDLEVVVLDPHRVGHELAYHPGETNFRRAHVLVINKLNTAKPEDVALLRRHVAEINPQATLIEAASPFQVEGPGGAGGERLRGLQVVAVEDGPTVTHGGMRFGAAALLAEEYGATLVDPRPHAVGEIADTYRAYPSMGPVLPAMGYSEGQIRDLEETLARVPCDAVVVGTPIDLRRIVRISQPTFRVTYSLQEIGRPTLADVLRVRGFI